MYETFENIRQEHTLTDDEIGLLTEIGSKQNEDFEDAFGLIHSTIIDMRGLVNVLESPQKASEAKKYLSNQKKIDTKMAQAGRIQDQLERAVEKAKELQAKFDDKMLEVTAIEAMQGTLGPDRLEKISEEYFIKLDDLTDTIVDVSTVLYEEHKDLTDILPFVVPYITEYEKLNEDEDD